MTMFGGLDFEEIGQESKDFQLDFQPIEEIKGSKKEVSRVRSLVSAPLKGFVKEVTESFGVESPQDALRRLKKGIPSRKEEIAQELEKFLPTRKEFIEKTLERAGRQLIPLPGGGIGKTALRAGLGALAGQTAEESGFGPIGQAVAEISVLGAPELGKKIIPRVNQKALVDFGRKFALKEQDIAKSIQSGGKLRLFSKFARRTPEVQKRLSKTKEALGNVFDTIRNSPEAQSQIPQQISNSLVNELNQGIRKLPSRVRGVFAADYEDFLNSSTTGDEIINLWQDINSGFTGNKKQLVTIKNILKKGLRQHSPELAKDFESANKLFSNFKTLEKSLKPSMFSALLDIGELGELVTGISTGSFGLIKGAIGSAAARALSTEMLLNPRFQNLSKKMILALNQNKFRVAESIKNALVQEIAKTDKDTANKLKTIDLTKNLIIPKANNNSKQSSK